MIKTSCVKSAGFAAQANKPQAISQYNSRYIMNWTRTHNKLMEMYGRRCVISKVGLIDFSVLESLKQDQFWYPVLLSTFAGLSTTIGGLLAVASKPTDKTQALLLGLAIGVMSSLSIVELYIQNGIEHGFLQVTAAFLGGGTLFGVLSPLVPDFVATQQDIEHYQHGRQNNTKIQNFESMDKVVDSGGRFSGSVSIDSQSSDKSIGTIEGTSLAKVQTQVQVQHKEETDNHSDEEQQEKSDSPQTSRDILRLGVLMTITMTLHNLPEGFAVAFSALTDFGPIVALAIAVHNIPEGLIVAAPLYAGTGSRVQAVTAATLSGLTEPLGAAVALTLARPLLTESFIELTLSFVGGIMSSVCIFELLPEGRQCKADRELCIGIGIGAAGMLWTLYMGV